LACTIDVGAERIRTNNTDSTIIARTASRDVPEALQGFHAPDGKLLFLLEEASGIDDIVFQVAAGALASRGSKVLMVANPTRNSGYFYNAFHANRARWKTMVVPWAVRPWSTPTYAEQVAAEYGEQSNVYRVRVLGEFPTTMDDALIPLEWIEQAVGRDVAQQGRMVVWGVDVGRGGDPSALIKRHGNRVLEPVKLWRDRDVMTTAGRVVREYEDTPKERRPSSICVDIIGVGAGVYDRLRELKLPVTGVNVGETQSLKDASRFVRLRDELNYAVREWFGERNCSIPNDPVLISELSAPSYKLTSSGKISVETKDEMKARGLKSPNAADALALTFAAGRKFSVSMVTDQVLQRAAMLAAHMQTSLRPRLTPLSPRAGARRPMRVFF
jgi:hypothetical protein